ncbi:UDP-glycosyltransferase 83A1 [Arachis hypogaea]|uniref:UDP-glycosyltransferase 83A1 n=1 Tax=Arachis hypogaea TaxID=3818 RepID=UPI000DEC68AC|nr:UDP-glycosyltransferase 83A1 [Arachis hypogaea]
MGIPHFLAIPYPILGHMNPLLQFCHVLAKNHGCKITFLSSDEHFKKLKKAASSSGMESEMMRLVSLPDGVDPNDDRSDQGKVILTTRTTMVDMLPKLIEDVNGMDCDNKITCVIVTKNMGWALQVALNLGIKGALFWPASATALASFDSMQTLIHQGIIDSQNGLPTKEHKEIHLSSNIPKMDPSAMPWYCLDNTFFFLHMKQEIQTLNQAQWWLCNTTSHLEPGALSISPKVLPIGPLMADQTTSSSSSSSSLILKEDETCIEWLDQQQPRSVVYVSFGSMVSIKPNQFKELALGLDLLNKPFLWVVRNGINGCKNNNGNYGLYPDEFHGSKGKIVNWAPQKKVLNHPAIACFVSHCGWNSTIEGVYSGVPFLCWPFVSDQLMNKIYICDVWKVGIGFEKGLILREEIKKKVEMLLGDEGINERCLRLKEIVIKNKQEGQKNLNEFINWAKE